MRTLFFIFFPVIFLLLISCNKDNSTNLPTDFSVTNTWECEIDGINYSGTIDTSFFEFQSDISSRDSFLFCTGVSADKKANIHFVLRINRRATGHDSLSTKSGQAEFNLDTSASNHLRAYTTYGGIIFHIEGLNDSKMKGSFYGTAMPVRGGDTRVITNGKFNFDISKGNGEPKFLSCKTDNGYIRGYVNHARLISNTLILDGLGFRADSTFQLMIRTGGQLKPGVYKSRNGDVGFKAYRPSIVTNYVSDVNGDLTVTIQSVSGNIVEGIFTGISQGIFTGSQVNITEGKFRCRVKNYRPQEDSINNWGFSESNELQFPFYTWGGNILKAIKSQDINAYYLTIYGESDYGDSKFKIKLRSLSPISHGIYESGNNFPNNADSVYFYCSPMNYTYYQPFFQGITCHIDSIDSQGVVGRFYGKLNLLAGSNSGSGSLAAVRRGYFKANF